MQMTHDPREALEPCPFCGANAAFTMREGHRFEWQTTCTECHCGTPPAFETKELAEAAWNARALTASAPKGEPCADWSDLPKDIYVIGAQRVDAVGFDIQCCSVPMVTAPEVRYVRAD